MAAGKVYEHVPTILDYPRNGRLEMDVPGRPAKEYDMTSLQTVPCQCRYAGIVLLEENFVSNSLIDLQDLWVKALIHIALASKRPPNYFAN